MHGSRYLTPDAFRTLTDTMIKAVDGACPVAVRKPAQWRELTLGWTEQEKKKLTLFNDGIFGSETDLGTYGTLSPETPGQKICSREEELEWQKNEMCGKFCGGEAIWGSGAEPAPFVSAPKAMADLERMHISYLNSTYDLRRWNNGKQKRSRTKAAWRQLENVSAIGLLWKVWSLFRKGKNFRLHWKTKDLQN